MRSYRFINSAQFRHSFAIRQNDFPVKSPATLHNRRLLAAFLSSAALLAFAISVSISTKPTLVSTNVPKSVREPISHNHSHLFPDH